jgi:hypothetical protein
MAREKPVHEDSTLLVCNNHELLSIVQSISILSVPRFGRAPEAERYSIKIRKGIRHGNWERSYVWSRNVWDTVTSEPPSRCMDM